MNLKTWILAFRPKTLTAAIGPVMIGTAMAYGDGLHHFSTALLCLLAALTIQIGTNLSNDYYDFKKGADTRERIRPVRVTQAGLIKPEVVKAGFIIAFGLAAVLCVFLAQRGGWPVIFIGVISILSGLFYTAGSKPLGYIGLGDVFVLIFFGPVAVVGTYYLQSLEVNMAVLLAGLAPGLISVAILCVNNMRDIDSDRKTNKRTLAVRFGIDFARAEYVYCILIAALLPVVIYGLTEEHKPILLASLIGLMAVPKFITICSSKDGSALNKTLASTGKFLLIYSILFSIGWVI